MLGAIDEAGSFIYAEPFLFHFDQHLSNLFGAQPTEFIEEGISGGELRKRKSEW